MNWFSKTKTQGPAFNPGIALEKEIRDQIYNALQGRIIETVIKKTKVPGKNDYWRSNMEGNSLKIDKSLLKDLYGLCQEVKEKLNYTHDVDFYITGDSAVNAFSVSAEEEGAPHIVNINSALFDLMTRDELKFVIGHELGHLINEDTKLRRLVGFVFPNMSAIPVGLLHKIRLHDQLAELVADRYGFMAAEDLGVCVTAFFKMASGLDLAKMNISMDALLEDNSKRLEYFLKNNGISRDAHPVNPIRVQALNLFANAESEEDLQKGINELISILLRVGDSELDEHIAYFIASAGIIAANCDGEVSKEEFEKIIEALSDFNVFPKKFLDEVCDGDVVDIFNRSVDNILQINPGMRENLLNYMINIILCDKSIDDKEVDFILNFGQNIGFSDIEISIAIARNIQHDFVPSPASYC